MGCPSTARVYFLYCWEEILWKQSLVTLSVWKLPECFFKPRFFKFFKRAAKLLAWCTGSCFGSCLTCHTTPWPSLRNAKKLQEKEAFCEKPATKLKFQFNVNFERGTNLQNSLFFTKKMGEKWRSLKIGCSKTLQIGGFFCCHFTFCKLRHLSNRMLIATQVRRVNGVSANTRKMLRCCPCSWVYHLIFSWYLKSPEFRKFLDTVKFSKDAFFVCSCWKEGEQPRLLLPLYTPLELICSLQYTIHSFCILNQINLAVS